MVPSYDQLGTMPSMSSVSRNTSVDAITIVSRGGGIGEVGAMGHAHPTSLNRRLSGFYNEKKLFCWNVGPAVFSNITLF